MNAATSGCGAKHAFQRQNETEMDGLDVYKELTKGGNLKRTRLSMVTTCVKEAWEAIAAEMVKKSIPKTACLTAWMGLQTIICGRIQENQHQQNQQKLCRICLISGFVINCGGL